MFKPAIAFLCIAVCASQIILTPPDFSPPFRFSPLQPTPPAFDVNPRIGPYRLCTYSNEDFTKCIHTVHVAENNSIPLALECVQKDRRDNCLRSVQDGSTDMVVLTGHGYQDARKRGLRPVLYGRDDGSSLYIAVAPRNLTLVDLQDAPIVLNQSDHGAFHAGLFFNLQRGHDICAFTQASLGPFVRIVNSEAYEPNDDEILICPNLMPGELGDYQQCNFEAGLQRAVFVRSSLRLQQIGNIRRIYQTILSRFGPNSPPSQVENGKTFNFFATFLERDNVLFKNNTVAFDVQPTYRNGIDEKMFNYLHCNDRNQPHDPLGLL